jgi:hypothetical protein
VQELEAARLALLQAVMATPQQHDPTVRACVDAEIQRIREADEATIHRMAQAAGFGPYRVRERIFPPAAFWPTHYAYRQGYFAKNDRWPTLTQEAYDLGIDRRTLWNYLHPKRAKKKNRPPS